MAKRQPIYFTSLELENVRCFGERQILDLTDDEGRLTQWTLLLGDNGVGKTTLLQCLAWMRPVPDPLPDDQDAIEPALDSEENEVWKSLLRTKSEVQLELDLKATFSTGRALGNRQNRRTQEKKIKTGLRISGKKGVLQEQLSAENSLPSNFRNMTLLDLPIFGYSANRRMGSSNLEKADLSDPLASLFSDSTELYDAEEVLLNLDYLAAKKKTTRNKNRLQQIKQILTTILPDIEQDAHIEILGPKLYPKESGGVSFKTPYGRVPLNGLSLGYRTTLAWTIDLAYRLYKHYPGSRNPLAQPAIVLVDEIDLHLHPRWQRHITEDLTHHFPNTQFIATAHSPLMVQAATNANLVVLHQRHGQVEIENRPHFVEGWRADQIVTSELFDVPARAPRIQALIEERHNLLNRSTRGPSDERRLKELDEKLDNLPTGSHEDNEAMRLIRQAAARIKMQGTHEI